MPTATSGSGAAAGNGTGAGASGSGASSTGAAAATSTPSTPVKVPSAAASYTPATLDPDLRSQINMVLIRDGHVGRIQDYLLHILNADSSNWPAAVQAHALQLLRSGEYSNFPALMNRIMDDIRHDTAGGANGSANGANGTANGKPKPSLALPQSVIDEALRATRESLDMVCEIEE
ncbi:hypothetical protein Sste5346_003225 [Sporothrix stenoceras]|uniref:Uncharacterized protein n=1 Tax=Sporothrix stenoceras TaxID=5173 RepID=A0ABR3ZFG5_9PEZI